MHLCRSSLVLCLALASLFLFASGGPSGSQNRNKIRRHANKIKGSYIVVYKPNGQGAQGKANGRAYEGKKRKVSQSVNMITVEVNKEADLYDILADPDVRYAEEDGHVRIATCESYNAESWGLDRVDQPSLPLNSQYKADRTQNSNQEVVAYIADTGIDANHPQFENRAEMGPEFMSDSVSGDGHGHGTHCAGTIGAYHHGVNRDVRMIGVKVLDSSGSGSYSAVIQGIDWVAANHTARGGANVARSVLSMSLGGGFSSSVNDATANAVAAGVVVVVAAGNSNDDVQYYSPASTPTAITVGSTTSSDAKSSFSNYGSLVDIQAPGSSIESTWLGTANRRRRATSVDDALTWESSGRYRRETVRRFRRSSARAPGSCTRNRCQASTSPTTSVTTSTTTTTTSATTAQRTPPPFGALATLSGTSMACPHVAGAVTLIMMNSATWLSPAQIEQKIKADAAKNVISGLNSATTKDLLQVPTC